MCLRLFSLERWRRQWQPTPVLLLGKSHGQRSLVGCSPWDRWESDTAERLHFHFSLSCIGEVLHVLCKVVQVLGEVLGEEEGGGGG